MELRKGDEEDQGNIQRNRVGRQLRKDQEDGQKAAKTKAHPRENHQLLAANLRENRRKRKRKNLRTHLRTLRKMTRRSSNNLNWSTTSYSTKQTNQPSTLDPLSTTYLFSNCYFFFKN